MEARKKVLLLSILIVMTIISGLLLTYILSNITGKTILTNKETTESNYSYTKAVCNEKNECIDVLIECQNGNVRNIKPASDLKKFPADWNNARTINETNFCK